MIGSELRASAWKYASIVLAVLAVAAVLAALFLGRLNFVLCRKGFGLELGEIR